jgi:glycosyltransferase involved in cell wall biosynthesis
MRIAILGSVALPIPPKTYGGIEWIAYYQAEGLVKRGHRVLLFASANSKTSADLVSVGKGDVIKEESQAAEVEASRKLNLELSYLTSVARELINRKDDHDLVLANMRGSYIFYPLVKHLGKKFIFVLHLPLFPELIEVFRKENIPLISISSSQRKPAPKLNWLKTVYNGVDPDVFKFSPKPAD